EENGHEPHDPIPGHDSCTGSAQQSQWSEGVETVPIEGGPARPEVEVTCDCFFHITLTGGTEHSGRVPVHDLQDIRRMRPHLSERRGAEATLDLQLLLSVRDQQ